MKYLSILAVICSAFVMSCTHSPHRKTAAEGENVDCGIQTEEITILSLQALATSEQGKAKLNCLFKYKSEYIHELPVGYSAGAGVPFDTSFFKGLTGDSWKGKIFFPSDDPKLSKGLNRINRNTFLGFLGAYHYVPMASFVTKVVYDHPLLKGQIDADKPVVVLNYTDPISTEGDVIEQLLDKAIKVYDLMVPVRGKNGHFVYVGKTWKGDYNKETKVFTASDPDNLIAWYFLDFSPEAVQEQQNLHGKPFKEDIIEPNDRRLTGEMLDKIKNFEY